VPVAVASSVPNAAANDRDDRFDAAEPSLTVPGPRAPEPLRATLRGREALPRRSERA